MKKENELEYYLEDQFKDLFAHGETYGFFEKFNLKNKKWETSKISFSQLLHDYQTRQISKEEASKITNGNLPEQKYSDYCAEIDRCLQ